MNELHRRNDISRLWHLVAVSRRNTYRGTQTALQADQH
jgi:hypothetical protein